MAEDNRDVFLIAGGHRLRARWYAPRSRPDQTVIVLLHQGLGSVSQWRNFPETLAETSGCAVVGYDRWGHGASDPLVGDRSPSFLKEEAERTLPEVLDALGLDRVVLHGHSDGGSITLLAAAALGDRVQAAVSEAAHVFSEVNATDGFGEVEAAFATGDLRQRLARHHGDNVDTMFHGWVRIWRSPAMRDWQMTDHLGGITCPTLVIQGTNDEHGSIAQVEAIAAGVSGPVETWMVPGIGHSPHLEATQAVADRCTAFLRRFSLA